PAVLGVWTLGLCIFLFVGKRTNAFIAACSILFIASTAASVYAFEARPYGIVLGFCGIALVSWQNCCSSTGFRRVVALALMTLSLAAAMLTHYFAFLLFAPIFAGELVRSVTQRRVDVPVWIGLLLGMTPVPFLLPLIRAARTYSVP